MDFPGKRKRETDGTDAFSAETAPVLSRVFTKGADVWYNQAMDAHSSEKKSVHQVIVPHFLRGEGEKMMYRKSQPHIQFSNTDLRLHRRVLLIVCIALFIVSLILGGAYIRSSSYQKRMQTQLYQRMYSASAAAMDEVTKLGSIVTSNASARLARVRQYIYYMEQLNAMSISLAGGEGGRIVPDDALSALFSDLESFENLLQQSTTGTLDARSLLITHLQALQVYLSQP